MSDWFTANVKRRTYFVPCAIIPDYPSLAHARPFAIGPVTFSHLQDFLKDKVITAQNPNDHRVYGPMFQAISARSATWIAEVEIDGSEETRASEIADLAIDVALVGIQLIIPLRYSRDAARITGRTSPPWVGSIHKNGAHINTAIQRRDPGFGFSGQAFDHFLSENAVILESVGRRVGAYVSGHARLGKIEQSWCDAAYWIHEGLAEPLDTIAVAKLETAIETLDEASKTSGSKQRLLQAIEYFYGRKENDYLATDPPITVRKYVKNIVEDRSKILHGTSSTLTENFSISRGNIEPLSLGLLRRYSFALDK
ncbi:MAG: hypothetical protein JOY71_27335, partial [Acetobacteraceae bacterium]|nr:hypothetical protein [Acetobacteraceae bacterium]